MTVVADLFDRAGRVLYGDQYIAPMAMLLGVDKNTIGKWRGGKSKIPAGIWAQILPEVERRERTLGLLREALIASALVPPASGILTPEASS